MANLLDPAQQVAPNGYRRQPWSGIAVYNIVVECGMCTFTEHLPRDARVKAHMRRIGWRWRKPWGWLCPTHGEEYPDG